MSTHATNRRDWLRQTGAAALGAAALGALPGSLDAAATGTLSGAAGTGARRHGRIRQSASRWCYAGIPLPQLCKAAGQIGLMGIDLLQRADWDVVNDSGLTCTMGYAADRRDFLTNGFTNRASHAMLIRELEDALPVAKQKNVPNLIAMFGNRAGRTDAEAIAAAIEGLKQVAPAAEAAGVTICVELLNSRVDHRDYHGDHTWFGVEVMKGVGSSRVKLLYDIYHMQIMEGDVIRTIRQNKDWIGHFHTGGVPGRHELDETQELNWRAVMTAIDATAYTGYVAHEFVPTRDPLTSLREAFEICNID
jgi:hydroxypyruvate isomerase